MDALEAIKKRRSVRDFVDRDVEWELVMQVVDAGKLAPCAGNLQSWKFVIVKEEAHRKKIADACLQQDWVAKAPAIIVVLSEPEKQKQMYGTRGERLYAIQGCAAAAENMLIAATALGLGSCWVSAFNEEQMRQLLNYPEHLFTQVVIPLGYAEEEPDMPPKLRLEHVGMIEKWGGRRKLAAYGFYSENLKKWIDSGKRKLKKLHKKITEGP